MVEKPDTCSVKPVDVTLTSPTERRRGAEDARASVTEGAGDGVRSKPDGVARAAVMVMVPALVPDCSRIWLPPIGKTASVEFAGMVKLTVLPPVANCTAGSAAKLAEAIVMVRVPLTEST